MLKKILLGAAGLVMLSTASASAYTITAYEYLTGGAITAGPFTCSTSAPASGTACAQFTYSGNLSFSDIAQQNTDATGDLNKNFFIPGDISGYTGAGVVGSAADFTSQTSFLNSSGSVEGYAWGSLYAIDLGSNLAGDLLTITHDDGVCVYQNGACLSQFYTGATQAVTESLILSSNADVTLYYTRQNGTPSVLQVSVPEPDSLAIFGAALFGLAGAAGWMRRNRKA